jgi:hypothetical protein
MNTGIFKDGNFIKRQISHTVAQENSGNIH